MSGGRKRPRDDYDKPRNSYENKKKIRGIEEYYGNRIASSSGVLSNKSDPWLTEVINIPTKSLCFVIGKKGVTVKGLKQHYGPAKIEIPTNDERMDNVPVTIQARWRTLREIINQLASIFTKHKRDHHIFDELLVKYQLQPRTSGCDTSSHTVGIGTDIVPHIDRSWHEESSSNAALHDTSAAALDRSWQNDSFPLLPAPHPAEAAITDTIQMVAGGNSEPISTGWGLLIDEQLQNPLELQPRQSTPATTDDQLQRENSSPNILEIEQIGFPPLSQHHMRDGFTSSKSGHMSELHAEVTEIVTFIRRCECRPECEYGQFRNAVENEGYIPMQLVSDQVLKMECPYCDEVKDFCQENILLEHLCTVHFYRRLSNFVRTSPPFACHVDKCTFQGKELTDLVLHYGAIPHRKVQSLVLDSVGERVRGLKERTLSHPKINQELKNKLDQTKKSLQNSEEQVKRLSSENENLQSTIAEKEKSIRESEKELESLMGTMRSMDQYEEKSRVYESKLRTENEKSDKLLKQVEELNSKLNEKNRNESNNNLADKEVKQKQKEIDELKKALSDQRRKNSSPAAAVIAEIANLKEQVKTLNNTVKRKSDELVKLTAKNKELTTKLEEKPASSDDADIDALRKTINIQKKMLNIKEQEISLLKESLE